MSAVATVAAKAVDCNMQTCSPTTYRRNQKKLRNLRVKLCITSWVYGFIFASPPFYGWGDYVLEGYGRSCSFNYISNSLGDMTFMIFLMIGGFVAPSLIISLSYGKAYWQMIELTKVTGAAKSKLNIRKITATKLKKLMLLAALNPTFVCWTPYVFMVCMAHFRFFEIANPTTILVCVTIAKLSGIYGPLMNIRTVLRLRKDLRS